MSISREMSKEEKLFQVVPQIIRNIDKQLWYRGGDKERADAMTDDLNENINYVMDTLAKLKELVNP